MNVYTVRSNDELVDILKTIEERGGGTIKLDAAGGPYQIDARGLGDETSPVTITSVDPENPAVVDLVKLVNASFVTISDLYIEGKEAGNPRSVYVAGSDHVTLTNNTMVGKADGFLSETGTATKGNPAGLFRDSTDITITNNTISHFSGGLGILEIDGLIIEGNEISYLQGDGIRGAGIQNASISDNYFHDFYGSTQSINHSDMIQLWGTNALTVTSNVTISGNILDTGDGALSQGIFIRNEEFGRGDEPTNGYFQNITITDNVVHNGAYHGITVANVDGLVVQSNTLLLNEAAYMYDAQGNEVTPKEPRFQISTSLNVTTGDNLGSSFLGLISEAGNTRLVYDNPADEMYVGNHIVNLSGGGDTDLRDLQIRSDSPLWGTTGSSLSSLSGDDVGLVIASSKVAGNAMELEFDASYGNIPVGSSIQWEFDDGVILAGETVSRVFSDAGSHAVQLVIKDADGKLSTLTRQIEVDDPYLFSFDFSKDGEDASGYGVEPNIKGVYEEVFVATPEDKGFHLTTGTGFNIGRENKQLNGLQAFEIDLKFRQDNADGEGGLLGIHTVFKLDIQPDGALSFWMRTDDGNFRITTDPGVMSDRDWHDIGVRYDSNEGQLSLIVDGATLASGAATGATNGALTSGLQLGRPWGQNAEGVYESFSMNLPFDATAPNTSDPVGANSVVQNVDALSIDAIDDSVTDDNVTDDNVVEPNVVEEPVQPALRTLLDIDFSNGGQDASQYNSDVRDKTDGQGFVAGLEGEGFQMGKNGNFLIEKTNSQLYELDAFNIGFDFRKDTADSSGGLLNQKKVLDLDLRPDGSLILRLRTDEGFVKLQTEKGVLSDTDWHHIDLSYDSSKGQVSILIDGEVASEAPLTGRTAEASNWHMVIGDPWHTSASGVMDNLQISRPATVQEADADAQSQADMAALFVGDTDDALQDASSSQIQLTSPDYANTWDEMSDPLLVTSTDNLASDAIIPF